MTERFTLLTELGRGGMGVVWKARDEETGQVVALKLLHAAYAIDADYVTRFERELELAKRIHSAHVVEVLGFGARDGTPYLALEYVDGPSLRELLASHGPYAWPEAKALLVQITQGLADAHAAGVVHRDLKPSNILVGPDGVAKLADFGIAKGLDLTRVTGTSTLLGTPAYLAPEGPLDERSDLYSLGIVAYELLTGAAPFTGSTYQEVIVRHIREAPDLGKLPPEPRDLVGWLLAKDPKDRPQRASALLPVLYGVEPVPVAQISPATASPVHTDAPSAPSVPPARAWTPPPSVSPDGRPVYPPASDGRGSTPGRPSRSRRRGAAPPIAVLGSLGLIACLVVGAIVFESLGSRPRTTEPSLAALVVPTPGQSREATTASQSPGISPLSDAMAKLDELDSYQFTEYLLAGDAYKGTVINQPSFAASVDVGGSVGTVVGDRAWWTYSYNDKTYTYTTSVAAVTFSLPAQAPSFVAWMNDRSAPLIVVGSEPKNGVQCTHYHSDGTTEINVWVATKGGYPVSADFATPSGAGTLYHYGFDITHINDPANHVSPPTTGSGWPHSRGLT
jgi:serine/threonine-protein kinase